MTTRFANYKTVAGAAAVGGILTVGAWGVIGSNTPPAQASWGWGGWGGHTTSKSTPSATTPAKPTYPTFKPIFPSTANPNNPSAPVCGPTSCTIQFF